VTCATGNESAAPLHPESIKVGADAACVSATNCSAAQAGLIVGTQLLKLRASALSRRSGRVDVKLRMQRLRSQRLKFIERQKTFSRNSVLANVATKEELSSAPEFIGRTAQNKDFGLDFDFGLINGKSVAVGGGSASARDKTVLISLRHKNGSSLEPKIVYVYARRYARIAERKPQVLLTRTVTQCKQNRF